HAQDSPSLASLDISLWPEYDRPELLVIYRGQLDADVELPASLEIAIPAQVGQPTAVAYVDEAGERLNQQYTTRLEGDSLIVTFELVTQRFQLEYYDALPQGDAGERTFTFAYTADYPTTAVNIEFQVPPTAQNFQLSPPADAVVEGGGGLSYHLVQAGTLAAGDTREWTFSYVKDNAELTAAGLEPVASPVPAAPATEGGSGDSTIWIFLVSFVALIGVGVTGYWLGHRTQEASQRVQPATKPRKRRGSGRGEQTQPPAPGGVALFCHQCGAELRSDSAFCHKCGASVRSE
ncbi:MAG: zinc-ribbon domain-containing protein, partial [Anaerolineae bacterium]